MPSYLGRAKDHVDKAPLVYAVNKAPPVSQPNVQCHPLSSSSIHIPFYGHPEFSQPSQESTQNWETVSEIWSHCLW